MISVAVVAVAAHYLLDLPWQIAVLLAAVTSPTDAAAVFSVLRRVPLRPSVLGTLEVESGLNDAPIVVIVTAVSIGTATEHSVPVFALIVAGELLLGGVVGFLVGRAGALILRGVALPSSGLYPLAVLAFAVLGYGGAAVLHGSGFAAVYVAALVLGNAELPHRAATRSFAEGVGWLAQIGLFVMLGLLASPGEVTMWQVWVAIVGGAILTFVARPLSVLVCAAVTRTPWREQAFLSWAGLRGAVPIVLATIPLAEGVPGSGELFNIVFVFVVVYTFVQAPSLPWISAHPVGDDRRRSGRGRRSGTAGADRGRPAADLRAGYVPPRGCGGGRAPATGGSLGGTGGARGRVVHPAPHDAYPR
ncbi:MAG: potassium/proton antiporter [Nocardioidaceae bacterium]